MKKLLWITLVLLYAISCKRSAYTEARELFQNPGITKGSVPFWWLNGKVTEDMIRKQLTVLRDSCGFSGVCPVPQYRMQPRTQPVFLSEDYLNMYGMILDVAKELGMEVIFYDDCDYPSGSAGDKMKEQFPDDLIKYLDRFCTKTNGASKLTIRVPVGKIMSVVGKDTSSTRWIALTGEIEVPKAVSDSMQSFSVTVPDQIDEIQTFVCMTVPGAKVVDALDSAAVRNFISLAYEPFQKAFPQHWGSTIKTVFYDDLSLFDAPRQKRWTPLFNEKFKAKYGFTPDLYYPALWENTGEKTFSERAQMYSMRDDLFSGGYPKIVQEWANQFGINVTGHPAGTYRVNPLQASGDPIKFLKNQNIPLLDYIHYRGHGLDGLIIPAATGFNYDKPVVICETYGNFQPDSLNDGEMLYSAAIELFARGTNYILPHGAWLDDSRASIPPTISFYNPKLGKELLPYNKWLARCQSFLQYSRHVSDIGVIYPIRDLQSRYTFDTYRGTNGREPITGTDYYEISSILTRRLHKDFTFLHPDVITDRCKVADNDFVLDNKNNWERYQVIIIPACKTISVHNYRKIHEFYLNGGKVIATTCLPESSFEPDQDQEVKSITK
jgi:hypothetical protein